MFIAENKKGMPLDNPPQWFWSLGSLNTFAIHPVLIIFYCFYYSRSSLGGPYSNQKKLFRKRNFKHLALNSIYFCNFTARTPVLQAKLKTHWD